MDEKDMGADLERVLLTKAQLQEAVAGLAERIDTDYQGTELLLVGHRPSWIIAAGFAGALDPAMVRNDLVLPAEVIDLEGRRFQVEPLEPLGASVRRARGRLVTVDRPVLEAQAKAELRRTAQADLVDMESSAVAAACA